MEFNTPGMVYFFESKAMRGIGMQLIILMRCPWHPDDIILTDINRQHGYEQLNQDINHPPYQICAAHLCMG